MIYYLSYNDLCAINRDGSLKWKTPVKYGTTPSINNDGVVYIGYYHDTGSLVDDKTLRIDKYLEKFNIYKEEFPFYADISFDTHELDEKSIISALEKKNLYTPLMDAVLSGSVENTLKVQAVNSIQQITVKQLDLNNFLSQSLYPRNRAGYLLFS
jgi:hypothetical protein